ncbi:hypothetical protein DFH09DRAFT_1152249 [Mycena vulgaris]|nr:hypothetical protein DFH09DRAFT_1152249 [Mycena vulgaris]
MPKSQQRNGIRELSHAASGIAHCRPPSRKLYTHTPPVFSEVPSTFMSAESLNLTLESFFGPILVGAFFAVVSHATLIVQSYALYERAPAVHQPWKALAGITWALDFIRIIFICQMAYQMFVVNWGDVLSIVGTPEPLILYLGFSGAQTLLCQGLLLYRVVRKQLPLCGAMGLASVAAFVLNTVASIQLRARETTGYSMLHSGGEFLASLALRAAVDAVVSMLLLGELKPQTNLALTRYLAVIFASGLATSVVALACVAAFAASSSSLAWLALHFALGGFCSNAVVTNFHLDINSRTFQRSSSGAAELLSISGPARSIGTTSAAAEEQMVEAGHISAYEGSFARQPTTAFAGGTAEDVRAWVVTNPRPDAGGESSRRSVLSDDYPPTYKSMGGPL